MNPRRADSPPRTCSDRQAQTLDALHAAKDEMEKSGLADKMKSGDPNDLFDAAEQYGKVFEKLATGVLAPKKILPTYKMLVESAKPPLPPNVKEFALDVAGAQADWDALLKRSFHTLKADGPFIYERAVVNATATDKLASLGDPPSTLRLVLVRFRLEGIDTGWKVVAIRRVIPGVADPDDKPPEPHRRRPRSRCRSRFHRASRGAHSATLRGRSDPIKDPARRRRDRDQGGRFR